MSAAARRLLVLAPVATAVTGAVLLYVMGVAADRSSRLSGMERAGAGTAALFLGFAGGVALVLGMLALALRRHPGVAGVSCACGGLAVAVPGAAGVGELAGEVSTVVVVLGLVLAGLAALGAAASRRGAAAPR